MVNFVFETKLSENARTILVCASRALEREAKPRAPGG